MLGKFLLHQGRALFSLSLTAGASVSSVSLSPRGDDSPSPPYARPLRAPIYGDEHPPVLLRQARSIQGRGAGAVFFQQVSVGPSTAAAMKIQKANAGVLTNFEVLDFLRSRGAKIDPMGCLGAVSASECKAYEYLLKTPACNQTRESIYEFVKRSEGFRLAEADKLNVINWRPSSAADAYAMIEECGKRFSRDERGEACDEDERVQAFLDMVKEVLPLPPKAEAEAEAEAEAADAEVEVEVETELVEAEAEAEAEALEAMHE